MWGWWLAPTACAFPKIAITVTTKAESRKRIIPWRLWRTLPTQWKMTWHSPYFPLSIVATWHSCFLAINWQDYWLPRCAGRIGCRQDKRWAHGDMTSQTLPEMHVAPFTGTYAQNKVSDVAISHCMICDIRKAQGSQAGEIKRRPSYIIRAFFQQTITSVQRKWQSIPAFAHLGIAWSKTQGPM